MLYQDISYNGINLLVEFKWSEDGADIQAVYGPDSDIKDMLSDKCLDDLNNLVCKAAKKERGENLSMRKNDGTDYC